MSNSEIPVPNVIIVVETPNSRKFLGPFASVDDANVYGQREIPEVLNWHTSLVYDSYQALRDATYESLRATVLK